MYSTFDDPPDGIQWLRADLGVLSPLMSRMMPFTIKDADKIRSHLGFMTLDGDLYIGAGGSRYFGFAKVCGVEADHRFFVPSEIVGVLNKNISGTVEIGLSGLKLFVRDSNTCIRACLPEDISTKFLNFTALVGRSVECGFALSSERFNQILQACHHVNQSEMYVRIRDGAATFIAVGDHGGGNEYRASMEYSNPSGKSVKDYDFVISPAVIMDFVKKCNEDVRMSFSEQRVAKEGYEWPSFVVFDSAGARFFMQSAVVVQMKVEGF
jgi:hypothetical protein